jgi:hypothetical protein
VYTAVRKYTNAHAFLYIFNSHTTVRVTCDENVKKKKKAIKSVTLFSNLSLKIYGPNFMVKIYSHLVVDLQSIHPYCFAILSTESIKFLASLKSLLGYIRGFSGAMVM